MGGFAAAWLTAEGIVIWRSVRASGRMVPPGQLLGVTLLYIALDIVATAQPAARYPATALAWGLNIAGLANVLPGGIYGPKPAVPPGGIVPTPTGTAPTQLGTLPGGPPTQA